MKILSIHYDDPHPVHRAWFESVGDVKRLEIDHEPSPTNIFRYAYNARKIPDDYGVIICEGGTALRTAAVKKLFNPGITVIRLVADQGLYECVEHDGRCFEERLTHRFVDGAIANSEFMKQYAEEFVDGPVEVVHPFIPDLDRFLEIEKDDYDTRNVLFIGYNYPNKNVDALVEAVAGLDVKLNIVGKGHREYDQENVATHGWVEDLAPLMQKCDLYVHPADGEAFGIAPAEAMASGIPAIVTENTGLKPFVQELDSELVTSSDPESLRTAIQNYYDRDETERRRLGSKARQIATRFEERKSKKEFEEKLIEFVGS